MSKPSVDFEYLLLFCKSLTIKLSFQQQLHFPRVMKTTAGISIWNTWKNMVQLSITGFLFVCFSTWLYECKKKKTTFVYLFSQRKNKKIKELTEITFLPPALKSDKNLIVNRSDQTKKMDHQKGKNNSHLTLHINAELTFIMFCWNKWLLNLHNYQLNLHNYQLNLHN